jgi:phosphopentomutase
MKSPGKDTTTGHWEIAGIILDRPFETFPPEYPSFPEQLVREFERRTGRMLIGNTAASGTEIIQRLGEEHQKTGALICYTSADSVFQIAAHEDTVPLEELYRACTIARELLDRYRIARVIARPFVGTPGAFTRTKNRKDFSIALPEDGVLEHLRSHGIETVGVGKIGNIFNEQGLDRNYPEKGNPACLAKTRELLEDRPERDTFIFVNLVDTDMVYGHRRDVEGYHTALTEVDRELGEYINLCGADDLLIVTADHGCDPTYRGTDHTREYVPLLVYRKGETGRNLGERDSHADIASSLAAFFGAPEFTPGRRFL